MVGWSVTVSLFLLAVACRTEPTVEPVVDRSSPLGQSSTALPAPIDADGDGYAIEQDCDDGDPAVHPGASERCNDRDDACDGGTDELAVSTVDGTAYPSLAAALAGAPEHSEIVVCPGTYFGPFSVPRAMVVASRDGAASTVLDGQGRYRAMAIRADGVEVRGFTITPDERTPRRGYRKLCAVCRPHFRARAY